MHGQDVVVIIQDVVVIVMVGLLLRGGRWFDGFVDKVAQDMKHFKGGGPGGPSAA